MGKKLPVPVKPESLLTCLNWQWGIVDTLLTAYRISQAAEIKMRELELMKGEIEKERERVRLEFQLKREVIEKEREERWMEHREKMKKMEIVLKGLLQRNGLIREFIWRSNIKEGKEVILELLKLEREVLNFLKEL
jgi:hypothetical protein